jgi:hypothetical protein
MVAAGVSLRLAVEAGDMAAAKRAAGGPARGDRTHVRPAR